MGGHTEKQKVAGERRSTYQDAVPGGTLASLWLPRACASQRGGLLASWGGPCHVVAYQVWASLDPCYRNKYQVKRKS